MPKLIPKRLAVIDPANKLIVKPELLSPAGDWDCARAAVENGADAIFFGLERFNARLRGKNFTTGDLPDLMAYLHARGVKGYVTFNTLVFANELASATDFLRSIIAAGVDAAIVQDVGICRLIRKLSPDFPIHASTQMSITSEAGIAFAKELDCSVVVLARECSLKEVGAIREKTIAAGTEVPIEIFTHGALCVAYSGQCLTSESLGGRSANRGECAQACRLPYELIVDEVKKDLGDKRYLLSPQDLSGAEAMPEIIRAGVATLKIEGRLKTPEYVAAVTQVYRRSLDQAWQAFEASPLETHPSTPIPPNDQYALEMTFSRGLYTGWLRGIDNQKLAHARFGKKRGVKLGAVERIERDTILLKLEGPLKVGDGLVFDAGRPDQDEQGGRILSLDTKGPLTALRFRAGSLDPTRIHPGDIVWKTSDHALTKTLRQSYQVEQPAYKRPLTATTHGRAGQPLTLELADAEGHVAILDSAQPLQTARNRPLDDATLKKQLSRLGDSPFYIEAIHNQIEGPCMLPVSQLNQLRRDTVAQLLAQRQTPKRWTLHPTPIPNPNSQPQSQIPNPQSQIRQAQSPFLIPYLRTWEQFEATLDLPYDEIYLELENPKHYAKAADHLNARNQSDGRARQLWVAPPRIYKTGEDWITKQLLECGAHGFLARNHEHLQALAGHPLRGDFSLNVSNHITAEYLLNRYKLQRLTASYDLNASQLAALVENANPNWFEITLHQHMPMFHMEHCVFCAFLSDGKDYRDCGRPCDKHAVKLRDRVGAEHPLKADAGCRNTVFNARAQTGAEFAQDLIQLGVRAFRIEFLNETPQEVKRALSQYESLIANKTQGAQLWRDLKLINQLGVTRGTLR